MIPRAIQILIKAFRMNMEKYPLPKNRNPHIMELIETSYVELPQALFQCGILVFSKSTKVSEASLIGLSIFISLTSLVFQMLQLNALTKKESYPSVPFYKFI